MFLKPPSPTPSGGGRGDIHCNIFKKLKRYLTIPLSKLNIPLAPLPMMHYSTLPILHKLCRFPPTRKAQREVRLAPA